MHFSIKNHHICGESTRKNHQKRTTWWRKIKTWHKIPLLVPTKQSPNATLQKNGKTLCYLRKPICQNDSKKHTTWWQKTKLRVCLHHPLLHRQNVPCATIPNAPNGQFYKNEKVTIDGRANQWYNSYINEVNHV